MVKIPEFFVTPNSLLLTDEEKHLLRRRDVGGVVLFGINIGSVEETRRLNDSIHEVRDDLIVATDEEGGIVSRLYHLMPSHSQPYVASLSDEQAHEYYYERAQRMRGLGFDLNLAPVVDIAPNRDSIMYKRTYGAVGEAAIHFAKICVQAQKEAGLASCLKHFPGVGSSSVDSHKEVPEIDATLEEWQAGEGRIYTELVKANPEYIMVGHVRYPKVDARPASSSQRWVGELRHGYNGKILIDDVTMKGFDDTVTPEQLAQYGVDGILVKNQDHPYVSGHSTAYEANKGVEA